MDTDDPAPDPLPDMPRRANYGDDLEDDRLYQDDMYVWKEIKQDYMPQESTKFIRHIFWDI